jgi:RNA polymerase sigma factor (sigma-70 family)
MTTAERWNMATRVEWLIDLMMNRWRVLNEDRDDVKQTCFLWLHEKVDRYDPTLSAWNTYAGWIIRSAIRQWRCDAKMYGPASWRNPAAQRLWEHEGERGKSAIGGRFADFDAETIEERVVGTRVARAVAALPEPLRVVLERRMQDEGVREIAEDVGVSHQRITQREQAAIKALRRRLAA